MKNNATDIEELTVVIEGLKRQVTEQDALIKGYAAALEKITGSDETKYVITTAKQKVDAALKVLDAMYHYNGGYSASPNGHYQAFWLRDIMYCTIAKEYMGDFASVKKSFGLILDIFDKYSDKIDSCIDNKPTGKHDFLHARFRVHTIEEFPDEWGHNQLDIFGLFLYKVGDLKKKGIEVLRDLQDVKRVQDIVWYLYSIRWHESPDYGVWEEGPEVHSSSVGSVLAGLMSIRENIEEVRVPARFIEQGQEALKRIMPRESESRPYDMAQLSLIWPYKVLDQDTRRTVLANVEEKLLGDAGVVRYPNDRYFNPDPWKPEGREAQWPMGFAWLSIVHTKIAEETFARGDAREAINLLKKAHHYVKRVEKTMTPGYKIPELFSDGRPNENTPLAWAQAMYVIAVQAMENLKAKMDRQMMIE
ncbi:MAG: hypothetical protein HZC51_03145 [Nitrospirae bacterium]|nr:hypothetical protein [Nitrospirota bacterium]